MRYYLWRWLLMWCYLFDGIIGILTFGEIFTPLTDKFQWYFINADPPRCPKCGQMNQGQSGEYPCSKCGLPMVWDDELAQMEA